jgi:hypothetical protein
LLTFRESRVGRERRHPPQIELLDPREREERVREMRQRIAAQVELAKGSQRGDRVGKHGEPVVAQVQLEIADRVGQHGEPVVSEIEHAQVRERPDRGGDLGQVVVGEDERLELGVRPHVVGDGAEVLLPEVEVLHGGERIRPSGETPLGQPAGTPAVHKGGPLPSRQLGRRRPAAVVVTPVAIPAASRCAHRRRTCPADDARSTAGGSLGSRRAPRARDP